jgi:hypothetical protein
MFLVSTVSGLLMAAALLFLVKDPEKARQPLPTGETE